MAAPALPSLPSSMKEMSLAFRGRRVDVLLLELWYKVVFEALMVGGEANDTHLARTLRIR